MESTENARSSDRVLARARLVKSAALALTLVTFAFLAISFGWKWEMYIQFPAGIACYMAHMWFRSADRRLAELEAAAGTANGSGGAARVA